MAQLNLSQQNLIAILGIEAMPEEKKLEVLEKVSSLVQKRLFVRIYSILPKDLQAEFEKILESENAEEASVFLEKNLPDLPQWIEEETSQIKEEMASWANSVA